VLGLLEGVEVQPGRVARDRFPPVRNNMLRGPKLDKEGIFLTSYLSSRPDSKASSSDIDSSLQLEVKAPVNTFVVRNGHFCWVEGKSAVLRNVNATILVGKLTLMVRLVGSGKTTLLHTLLGETVRLRREVLHTRQAIAFCAQQPWLTNTTARKAIVGHY